MNRTAIIALAFLALAGAVGAQNVNPIPGPTYRSILAMPVPVIEGDITDHPYVVVGPVKATVAKLTRLSRNPSNAQLAGKLWENARKLGAHAVVGVKFGAVEESGWTYARRQAEGQAVRFLTPAEVEAIKASR